jgi:DNA-binding winged helix-turn-helix (wHTH) protein/tetratricopeptide (TPR) repeat protein
MSCYRFGTFDLDLDAFVLRQGDSVLSLQPKVLDVLRYLVEHRGRMVGKAELLDQLWPNENVNEAVLTWSVSHIRRALGQQRGERQPIETVHGRGYRFVAEVSVVTAPPPSAFDASAHTSLIGRARVMAELERCVRRAKHGEGALCAITGEAGIGKTRCAEELARSAKAQSLQALVGRSVQLPGAPPLWPIQSALSQSKEPPAEHARRLIASLGEQEDGDSPERIASARFRTLEQIARALHELAEARPTLLIVDDLQWSDALTLQLLGFIAPQLAQSSLCVVVTMRDRERDPSSPRERYLGQLMRFSQTIPLGALDVAQVGELMSALMGHAPQSELADAVHRASGGVPLYVHEVVRSLLREHGPRLASLAPSAVRVPELARDVLNRRIEQLPESTRETLACAAVIGEQVELSLLALLCGLEPEVLLDRLAPAIEEGQLAADAPHVYRFAHALFHRVLLDALPVTKRVTLHAKLGQLLCARPDAAMRKGEIARHLYLSLPASNPEDVVQRACEAADAARRVLAFDEAVLYFGWALEAQVFAGSVAPRARAELLLSLATAQRSAGRTNDATDTAARVIELAQQHDMHNLVVEATHLRRPTVALAFVPDDLSRAALEVVLASTPEVSYAHVGALAQLSTLPPYDRDLLRSKAMSARAVTLGEQLGDREALFAALRGRSFALSGPDDIEAALAIVDRIIALDRQGPHSTQCMDARVVRYATCLQAGRISEADQTLDGVDEVVGNWQWGEAAFFVKRMRAQRSFLDGRFDEAEQHWKTIIKKAVHAGVAYAELLRKAQALNLELEREGPRRVFERHRETLARTEERPLAVRIARARVAAQAGAFDMVRANLRALGDPGDYTRGPDYLNNLAGLAVCAATVEDGARCEQLLELLGPYAHLNTPDALGFYLGSAAHFVALLCATLGHRDEAYNLFDRALEHNASMGYRPGVVHTRMAYASLAERGGDVQRAHNLRDAARAEAASLGMHAY